MVAANSLPGKTLTVAGVENCFHVGDVVLLGVTAPPEFRHRQAVVTHVQRTHCTVCVLDESGRCAIGECWPDFEDLALASQTLRLGVRVVIDGCSGPRTQLLNGHAGIIVSHKQGHPCFIHKGRQNDGPQLNVCVRLEQPPTAFPKSVLIEPRFLVAYDERVDAATSQLDDVVRVLSQAAVGTMPLPQQTEGHKQVSTLGVSTSDSIESFRGGRDSSPSSGAASSPREDAEPPIPVSALSEKEEKERNMLFDRTILHAVEAKGPAELAACSGLQMDAPETFLVFATRAQKLAELARLDDVGCAEGEIACSSICGEQGSPDLSSKYEHCTPDCVVESFARRGKRFHVCYPKRSYAWQLPWTWFVVRLLVALAWLLRMEHSCLAAVYIGSLFCQWFHFLARRHLDPAAA